MSFTASSSEDLDVGVVTWFDDDENGAELEDFVQCVPKVELHVHLDGCFDPKVLWDHLTDNPHLLKCFEIQKSLPWEKDVNAPPVRLRDMVENCETSLDYRRLCTCRRRYRKLRHPLDMPRYQRQRQQQHKVLRRNGDHLHHQHHHNNDKTPKVRGSLEDMLLCFEFLFPLVYDNFELLEHLAYDFVMRQYEQNVIYCEVRYSPHLFASDAQKAFQAVQHGLRRGCTRFPTVMVNQILCAINFAPQWSSEIVDMATEYRNDYPCAVVGIDVAAGEDHFDAKSPSYDAHLSMCKKAQQLGINITMHAGETPDSSQNVPSAVHNYGATRIGHGYHISNDDDILNEMKRLEVHFEVCPTSSVETGGWIKTTWPEHPACALKKKGIKLSLNSDDPAVFNTDLSWQYRIAIKKMGWTTDDIVQVLFDTVDAAFVPDDVKRKLKDTIRSYQRSPSVVPSRHFRDRVHYD
jgi:adenosine deaminase